jgi:hypothetical protein
VSAPFVSSISSPRSSSVSIRVFVVVAMVDPF